MPIWGRTVLTPVEGGGNELDEEELLRQADEAASQSISPTPQAWTSVYGIKPGEALHQEAVQVSRTELVDLREKKLRALTDKQALVAKRSMLGIDPLAFQQYAQPRNELERAVSLTPPVWAVGKAIEGIDWLSAQAEVELARRQAGEIPEELGGYISPLYPNRELKAKAQADLAAENVRQRELVQKFQTMNHAEAVEYYRETATPEERIILGSLIPGIGFMPMPPVVKGAVLAGRLAGKGIVKGVEAATPFVKEMDTSFSPGAIRLGGNGKRIQKPMPKAVEGAGFSLETWNKNWDALPNEQRLVLLKKAGIPTDIASQHSKEISAAAKTQMGELGFPAEADIIPPKPPGDITPSQPGPPIGPRRSMEEAKVVVGKTAQWFFSQKSDEVDRITQDMFKAQRAKRAAEYSARIEELRNNPALRHLSADELEKRALESMKGPLQRPQATLSRYITEDISDAMFDMVYHTWHGTDAFEEMSTAEALRNALLGKGIPRKPGTGTQYFPEGGSAYERLANVFKEHPELLKALEKNKTLDEIVQEKLTKSSITEPWKDYTVPPTTPYGQPGLFEPKGVPPPTKAPHLWGEGEVRTNADLFGQMNKEGIALRQDQAQRIMARLEKAIPGLEGVTYQPPVEGELFSLGTLFENLGTKRTSEEIFKALQAEGIALRQDQAKRIFAWLESHSKDFIPEGTLYQEPPIKKAMGQASLFPMPEQALVVRILKEMGLTTIDIGNALKTTKASFDNSWWRQNAPLILNHKRDFIKANLKSWHAFVSEKAAKSSWDGIVKDPLYHIYDKLKLDFLRPYEIKPGSRALGVEEFGFLTKERPIPNFLSKVPGIKHSQRGFITGLNEHNWRIFKDYYQQQLNLNAKIASGKVVLKPQEVFSIEKNLNGLGTMLEDMSGRAKLGPMREMAPAINAGFFAMRLTLGRILTPRHLVSANPYVRKEAFRNLASFVGTIGGVMVAGKQMGLWDVDYNSNSPTFARIRIGNTYYDPWGGYQKYVRFTSQMITGTGLTVRTGKLQDKRLTDAVGQFMTSISAPGPGLITEFTRGKTYTGEKVDIKNIRQWADRLGPMLPNDIYDAFVESGPSVAASSVLPAVQGISVQSYKTQNYDLVRKWSTDLAKYEAIPTNDIERVKANLPLSRIQYRNKNPIVDARLFASSQVLSLTSPEAAYTAAKLIKEQAIDIEQIEGIKERIEELKQRREETELGPPKVTPVDLLMKELGMDVSPTVVAYSEYIKRVQYYDKWNVRVIKAFPKEDRPVINKYLSLKDSSKPEDKQRASVMLKTTPSVRQYENSVESVKVILRLENPDLDRDLQYYRNIKPLDQKSILAVARRTRNPKLIELYKQKYGER